MFKIQRDNFSLIFFYLHIKLRFNLQFAVNAHIIINRCA